MNPIQHDADGAVILKFIFKNRKLYLATTIVAIIAGIAVTFFITPKYNSYAIVFPVQNNSIESVVDNPVFGYDVEADRLLQVLHSDEVFDSCVTKFHLYSVLEIDSSLADGRDRLKEKFHDRVSFSRSQYVSIIISATMADPQMSADLVNYIITLSDGIRNRIYKKNLQIVYQSLDKEYMERRNHLDLMTDSITKLRASTSIEVLTMMNNQIVLKNNDAATAKEQTYLERLLNNYLYEQSQVNELAGRYAKAKTQYERPTTQVFVVQYAKPSYLKQTPDYLLNTLITVLCSLVFITGFVLIRNKLNTIDLRD